MATTRSATVWYNAATATGAPVESNTSLPLLVEICRQVMDPDGEDVIIADASGRIHAVVLADGRTVYLSPRQVAVVREGGVSTVEVA